MTKMDPSSHPSVKSQVLDYCRKQTIKDLVKNMFYRVTKTEYVRPAFFELEP